MIMSKYIRLHQKHFNFKKFIKNALAEDVGDGDHTVLSTIPKTHKGKMQLFAKDHGIIAGVEAAKEIFKIVDPKLKLKILINDGQSVIPGDVVLTVEGNTQKLLSTERLILNIMQRMSGIATKTNALQKLCEGTKA